MSKLWDYTETARGYVDIVNYLVREGDEAGAGQHLDRAWWAYDKATDELIALCDGLPESVYDSMYDAMCKPLHDLVHKAQSRYMTF